MSRRSRPSKVMSVEDCDEEGNIIAGTESYAASVASPTKERMNTSKKKSRRGESSSSNIYTDSDSTLHPTIRDKTKSKSSRDSRDKERDRTVAMTSKKVVSVARPSVKNTKTQPVVSSSRSSRKESRGDDASYYAADPAPMVQSGSSRPRAQTAVPRPTSYHPDRSRPPLSNTRYHTPAPAAPFPPPPPPSRPMQIPFPPPPQPQHMHPSWPSIAVSYPQPPVPLPPPPQPDYFTQPRHPANLAARFGSAPRPASAMAHRSTTAPVMSYRAEYADPIAERTSLNRRPSLTRRSRHDADRDLMPPPPPPLSIPQRPRSAMPVGLMSAGAFAPPSAFPPPPVRNSAVFDDEDFEGLGSYQDISPLSYEIPYRTSRSRRPSIGATTIAYETAPVYTTAAVPYTTEIARGGGSRRSSYYGGQGETTYEDVLRRASVYQSEVDGGSHPLTAESLRKASRRGGSSRSSGSHEDSDWKQSATTQTTQSASDEVTIQVKRGTTFKVGGVPLECQDGAVFSISSRATERGDRDRGSDRSSYMGEEERRGRLDRVPSGRRAPSQSASYSRGMGPTAYDYGAYGGGYGYTQTGYAPPSYHPGGYF